MHAVKPGYSLLGEEGQGRTQVSGCGVKSMLPSPADLAFRKVVPLQGMRSWSNQESHTSNPKC